MSALSNITFECEIITPMFLTGADGRTPELRPPSIKGMMRFWWRAIMACDVKTLRDKEAELFGTSDQKIGRSKIALRIVDGNTSEIKYPVTPHHNESYCKKSNKNCDYKKGKCTKANKYPAKMGSFKLIIMCRSDEELEYYKSLLEITFILGGVGKRARRGFGSLQITKVGDSEYKGEYNEKNIRNLLNNINPQSFEIDPHNTKIRNLKNNGDEYPWIKEIEIGKEYDSYNELSPIFIQILIP